MITSYYEEDTPNADVELYIFKRDEDGNKIQEKVENFRPYFFVKENIRIDNNRGVLDEEYGYKGLEGEDIKKVICDKPSTIGKLRNDYTTWESDVHYPTRYALDEAEKDDNGDLKKNPLRVCYLDIEIMTEDGKFPSIEDAEQDVISITCYDSFDEEYKIFAWFEEEPEELEDLDNTEIIVSDTEKDLLKDFMDYIDDRDPDILAGWNVENFDMTYLVNRMGVLGINPDKMSSIDKGVEVSDDYRETDVYIPGKVVLDQLKAYKFMVFGKEPSYSLDDIANKVLGEKKIQFDEGMTELWREDPNKLLKYNKKDVRLCVDLDDEMDMIEFTDTVRRLTYASFHLIFTPMIQVYGYMLRKGKTYGVRMPRGEYQEQGSISGGYVLTPQRGGILEDIHVADLKSLYPSLIISGNMSPETVVEDSNGKEDTIHFSSDKDIYTDDWKSQDYNDVDIKFLSHDEKEGFLPKVLSTLFDNRAEYKKLMRQGSREGDKSKKNRNDRKQRAIKVLMNCFSEDTRIMTEFGPRFITEVEEGMEVYTINPNTQDVELKEVKETTVQENKYGELAHLSGNNHDFKITPNHRMLVSRKDEEEFNYEHYEDLEETVTYKFPNHEPIEGDKPEIWDITDCLRFKDMRVRLDKGDVHGHKIRGMLPNTVVNELEQDKNTGDYIIPMSVYRRFKEECDSVFENVYIQDGPKCSKLPKKFKTENWLELLGWYISEGSLSHVEEKKLENGITAGETHRVTISQNKCSSPNNWNRIKTLLDEMNIDYSATESGFYICNKPLYQYLSARCGGNSFEKRIPHSVFDLDYTLLKSLYGTLMLGDGTGYNPDEKNLGYVAYGTSSVDLSRQIPKLMVHLGKKPAIRDNYGGEIGESGEYRIREQALNQQGFTKQNNGSYEEHGGKVYCLKVEDNHNILAGRKGTYNWVGQTMYGVLSNNNFNLYRPEIADAITWSGRTLIQFSRQEVEKEFENEVIYGDSVTGDTPVYVKDSKGNIKLVPIKNVAYYNENHKSGKNRNLKYEEVLTRNGFKEVKYVKKHKTNKDIFRVVTHRGGKVKVTEDHSLFDKQKNKVKPGNIDEGDILETRDIPEIDEKVDEMSTERAWYSSPGDVNENHHKYKEDGHVKHIERIDTNEEYVYDISTDDGTFVVGHGLVAKNTDSIMYTAESIKESQEMIDFLNNRYNEFARGFNIDPEEHQFILEYEKVYRRVFFQLNKKKRYAGLKTHSDDFSSMWIKLDDGSETYINAEEEVQIGPEVEVKSKKLKTDNKIKHEGEIKAIEKITNIEVGELPEPYPDITGFEAVRANNSSLTQEVQERVFELLLKGKGSDAVIDYLKEVNDKLRDDGYDLEKIAIPQGISMELSDYKSKGPHVKGAIYANRNFETNFGEGSDPKLIYVKSMPKGYPMPEDGAVCFEEPSDLPNDLILDYNKMEDKVIRSAVNNIFPSLNINYSRVHGQKGLGDF